MKTKFSLHEKDRSSFRMRVLIGAGQTNHLDPLGTPQDCCDQSTLSIQPFPEPGAASNLSPQSEVSSPRDMGSPTVRGLNRNIIIISDGGQMISPTDVFGKMGDDLDQTLSSRTIEVKDSQFSTIRSGNGSIPEGEIPGIDGKAITSVYMKEHQTVTEGPSSASWTTRQDSSSPELSAETLPVHSQTNLYPSPALATAIIELEGPPRYSSVLSVTLQRPRTTNTAATCARLQPSTHSDTNVSNSIPPTNSCESLPPYTYDEPVCDCLLNIFDFEGPTEKSPLTKTSFNSGRKPGLSDQCSGHKSYINEAFLNSEKHDSRNAEEGAGLGSVKELICPYSARKGSNAIQDVLEKEHKGTKVKSLLMEENAIVKVGPEVNPASVPEYLQLLLEGMDVCGDGGTVPNSRPDWLDMDKFRRGQRFAINYMFGLVYAEMISLMMLFSFPDNLEPLIFTGKSGTPFKSYQRYLSTLTRVVSWYRGDVWTPNTEASNNLQTVRAMHSGIRHRLNTATPHELNERLTLQGTPAWSTLGDAIRSDMRASQPYADPAQCPYLRPRTSRLFVNQADMAITQFGFVGLMVLYPGRLGAHGIKDEDLEGFLHFWRGIGYLLGIADRYNFCSGNLEEVRQRSRDLIEYYVKPNLQHVTRDWEHMHRCVVEGISYYVPGTSFESSLLYLCRLLDLETPHLRARLSLWQQFLYFITIFVMCFLLRLPGSMTYHNWLLRLAIKRAQKTSPGKLHQMQTRVYSYQKQAVPKSHVEKCDASGHCSFQPIAID